MGRKKIERVEVDGGLGGVGTSKNFAGLGDYY